jgi:hypothetical protein
MQSRWQFADIFRTIQERELIQKRGVFSQKGEFSRAVAIFEEQGIF